MCDISGSSEQCHSGTKERQVNGCVGTTVFPDDAFRTCYTDQSPQEGCQRLFGEPCPTFLTYVVDRGFLDPGFETYVSSSQPADSAGGKLYVTHFERAIRCTTESGRHYFDYTHSHFVDLDDFGFITTLSAHSTKIIFDSAGLVEAIQRQQPTCCSGVASDLAWWGDPGHPGSFWCNGNPTCDPNVDCVELTPDDIRVLQRLRGE
ncbi:MAG: hypothetical protein KC621_02185 [Myxococcales bacterium]|nr:hypothetical protein [Myxococcales bacterium]